MKALFATLIVVLLDQASKLYIKGFAIPFLHFNHDGMSHGRSLPVMGDFFRITYVENPGMAFGIEVTPTIKLFICLFSILASIGLFYYLYTVRKHNFSLRLSLALILGGALGNLIDRLFYGVFYDYAPLFYGRVVDFLHFSYGARSFPIFNVADSAVTVGVCLMLLFYKQNQEEPGVATSDEPVAPDSEKTVVEGEEQQVSGEQAVSPDVTPANNDGAATAHDGDVITDSKPLTSNT